MGNKNIFPFQLQIHSFISAHQLYYNKMCSLNSNKNESSIKTPLKVRKPRQRTRLLRNTGCWSEQQQGKYIEFLSFSRRKLQYRSQRKNNNIFKEMADYVGSRDGIQCRSHHVKLLRTHKQICKIIERFQCLKSTSRTQPNFDPSSVNQNYPKSLSNCTEKRSDLAEAGQFCYVGNEHPMEIQESPNELMGQSAYKFFLSCQPVQQYHLVWVPLEQNIFFSLPL